MEFDKSKVYTSLNADELEVGSEVILADYLEALKFQVEANSWPTYVRRLDGVMGTSSVNRFRSGALRYNLAYLVRKAEKEEETEEKKWIVYLARYQDTLTLCGCTESYWETAKRFDGAKTKLFVGSENKAKEWSASRRKFIKVIKAFEDGKTIQYSYDPDEEWVDIEGVPAWNVSTKYRVKPDELVWTSLKVGDVLVTDINNERELKKMVIGIDLDSNTRFHVCLGNDWIDDENLLKWRKAE